MAHKKKFASEISGSGSYSSSPDSDCSENLRYPVPRPSMLHKYCPSSSMDQRLNSLDDIIRRTLAKNRHSVTAICSNIGDPGINNIPQTTTTIPCTSFSMDTDDAAKQLHLAVTNNGFLTPSISPNSIEDSGENTFDMDIVDGENIYVPKYNSHGKLKEFKCKHCSSVFVTKADFWKHMKVHFRSDKILSCPKCPFVTELKHHYKFHILNHSGNKPHKCDQCNYACVNKSMLNSHLKSHSSVYQYGCSDCQYVTKHCHSLKIHLRKEGHKPSIDHNTDGIPNPLPIIDVYGSRRGPKVNIQKEGTVQESSQEHLWYPPQMPFVLTPFLPEFQAATANPFLFENATTLLRQDQESLRENQNSFNTTEKNEIQGQNIHAETGDLDLIERTEQPVRPQRPVQKNRHKNRANKLEPTNGDTSDEEFTTMFSFVEVVENIPVAPFRSEENHYDKNELYKCNKTGDYSCQHCIINFGDPILHSIHMGFHNFRNPFTCNICGEDCKEKIKFFIHIARASHS